MITIEQIRAARALLNWSQEELASAAVISKPAVANLERGSAQPRTETLNAIQKALEDGGMEFLDNTGVRLRGEKLNVQAFEGKNAIFRLWDDQFETLHHNGGVRMFFGIDEKNIDHLVGQKTFRNMMEKFHKNNITSKLLIREGDTYFVEPVSHYRWISNELFEQIPFCVYGNKYAINITSPHQQIIIIESKTIAESYRKQFEHIWENAKIPVTSPS